jgi:DNA topoisomerase IA
MLPGVTNVTRRFSLSISVHVLCAGEGLITYMRTDGVNLSAEAVDTLRGLIGSQYGASYLPPAGSRVYKTRAKNAQEAHEAIRPTNPALLPGDVEGLTPDQVRVPQDVESVTLRYMSFHNINCCTQSMVGAVNGKL